MTSGLDDPEKRHIVDGGRESAEAADRSQSLGAKTYTARLANDGGSEQMRPPQGDVESRQGTKHEWRPRRRTCLVHCALLRMPGSNCCGRTSHKGEPQPYGTGVTTCDSPSCSQGRVMYRRPTIRR